MLHSIVCTKIIGVISRRRPFFGTYGGNRNAIFSGIDVAEDGDGKIRNASNGKGDFGELCPNAIGEGLVSVIGVSSPIAFRVVDEVISILDSFFL